jgi:hypothetical protein
VSIRNSARLNDQHQRISIDQRVPSVNRILVQLTWFESAIMSTAARRRLMRDFKVGGKSLFIGAHDHKEQD